MQWKEKLNQKRFVVTIEIQPVAEDGIYQLLNDLNCIKGRIDCMNIPEFKKPDPNIDSFVTGKALAEQRFDTIYQTTVRHKHRPNLEVDLLKAHQIGIQNILVFNEDYTLTGTTKDEKMFFHVDSAKLFSVLENLGEGMDIKGKDLPKPVSFCVGSGIDAGKGKKISNLEMKKMEHMIEKGTRFFQTTPVFDLDAFKDFMRIIEPFGVSILAGVMLLRTGELASFLKTHKNIDIPDRIIEKMKRAPYKLKASIEIFTELVAGLRDLCQGIHIIPMGWYDRLPLFLDSAKL